MARFEAAIQFVLDNEGGYSNHAEDRGGATRYGITANVARAHGRNVESLTLADAKAIYEASYWRFDGIVNQAVATKLFDICVNVGLAGGTRLVQRVVGVPDDGIFGAKTLAAINAHYPETVLRGLEMGVADYYAQICQRDPKQVVFLRGWIRRAFRRPAA